jgi:hypothetical protein
MLFIHLLVSFFILLSIHVVVRLSGFCLCNLFNLFMEVETCVDVDVPVHSQLVNVLLLDLFSSVSVRWLGLIVDKKS